MARRTKLTPALQKRITDSIRAGNYAFVAAQQAGIHEATYHAWRARGRKEGKGIYREFDEAVEMAEAEAEAVAVMYVRRAMGESWQAAMTYLERKFPDRWGKRFAKEPEAKGSKAALLELIEAMRGEA